MTNLFGLLDIEVLDLIEIWCLRFEISEVLNTRDFIFNDYPSIEYSTVKFHIRVVGRTLRACLKQKREMSSNLKAENDGVW